MRYPKHYRERARAIAATGKTVREVSREMGIPYPTVWRWTTGGEFVSLSGDTPEEVKAEALRCYANGEAAGPIAARSGVCVETVYRWAVAAEVNRGPRRKITWEEAFAAYREHGTYEAAGAALGVRGSSVHRAMNGR